MLAPKPARLSKDGNSDLPGNSGATAGAINGMPAAAAQTGSVLIGRGGGLNCLRPVRRWGHGKEAEVDALHSTV
jgi:hypothetical protein